MASGTATPQETQAVDPNQVDAVQVDSFIEDRIRQTRRQVRGVDIAGGLIVMAIGTVVYLMAAAVIDHWIVSGGLGFVGRLVLLLVLLAAASAYFVRYVLPAIRFQVNPIFAAETLERSRLSIGNNRSLKNSLINFLLLRGHRREVLPVVYRALQQRAATDLSRVEIETAVDRKHVFRLAYVLVGVMAIGALYHVISPKNPLISAARVIWPFAALEAPTRVTIEDVRPGSVDAYFGDVIEVSAEIDGLKDDETVLLRYSSNDGQIVDQVIPMTLSAGAYRHRCELPPSEGGLRQSVTYHLTAGDCKTARFSVTARTAPAIVVKAVEYDYPEYTGIADWTAERKGGDLRAIEGTHVTITAETNREPRTAEIDFDCDGDPGQRMTVRDKEAVGRFMLSLIDDDPPRPKHESYQLRFTDVAGLSNPQPIRHRIEVIRDLPPVVDLLAPGAEDLQLPEDGRLAITVRATDPDFALRRVVLQTDAMRAGKKQTGHQGERLSIPPLLDKLHEGEFKDTYYFEPAQFKLVAGDRVLYWVEAEDNKQPHPGRSRTVQRWITIIGADRGQPQQQPDARGDRQPKEQPREAQPGERSEQDPQQDGHPPEDAGQDTAKPQPGDEPPQDPAREQEGSDEPGEGDAGEGSPKAGEGQGTPQPGDEGKGQEGKGQEGEGQEGKSDQPSEPIDGATKPGDFMDKVLEHQRKEQENQAQEDGQKQDGQQQDGQQQDGQQQDGQQQDGQKQDGQKQDGQQQDGQQQDGQQQDGQQQDGQKQDGQQQDGHKQDGQKQDGQKQDGQKQDGQKQKTPGAEEGTEKGAGSPKPQQEAKDRQKQSGESGGDEEGKLDSPESPGMGKKDSDTQGQGGDRKGGGDKGGGQQGKRPGKGEPGSQTPADKGGTTSDDPGGEETGAGTDAKTDKPTGNSATRPEGGGRPEKPGSEGAGKQPKSQDADSPPGTPQKDPSDGGNPGDRQSKGPGARGQGNPTQGGAPDKGPHDPPPKTSEPGGDAPDLEHVRKQFDLALQHLRDQLAKEHPDQDLLDSLGGMTREELAENARRWEEMRKRADQQGAGGRAARKSLGDFLKSLGLRPRGTQLKGDGTPADQLHNLRDAGRFPPPPKWAEQFDQYNRGVAGSGR